MKGRSIVRQSSVCADLMMKDVAMLMFNPPRAQAPVFGAGVLRSTASDFVVHEQLGFDLSGDGEHLWLNIEKQNQDTQTVARTLARAAGIPLRDIGYAGLKDRRAITQQWFSLRLPGQTDHAWLDDLPTGVSVIEQRQHHKKLQRGAHQSNEFMITVRELEGGTDKLNASLAQITKHGIPNYFGPQRFGHEGRNIAYAEDMLAGRIKVRDRHKHGLYLSAARALLFNAVLAARVNAQTWAQIIEGEAVMLDGSNSYFINDGVDKTLPARLAAADVHPSGPLWGADDPVSRAQAQSVEAAAIEPFATLAAGLASAGLRSARRALRVVPRELSYEASQAGVLHVRFTLPSGSYATAVIAALVENIDIADS